MTNHVCPYCRAECATHEALVGHLAVCTLNPLLTGAVGTSIYVSPDGYDTTGDGSEAHPYLTLTKALSVATLNHPVIYMLPGSYVEPAAITWPNINGIRVIGLGKLGGVTVSCPTATAGVIVINPTYTASTFTAGLENIAIGAVQANNGAICIDNAHMTKKLMPYLIGVSTGSGAYGTIVVAHTTAGQAIRISADGCDEVSGLFSFVVANSGDRCRIRSSTLNGGFTATGAVAGEIYLQNVVVLTGAFTTDAAQRVNNVACVYRSNADPAIYTALADAWDT